MTKMSDELLAYLTSKHKRLSEYATPTVLRHIVGLLTSKDCEFFDFGELDLEKADDKNGYRLPELTDEELEFWFEGLIPTPSNICWYQFTVEGIHSALLIIKVDGEVWAQRIESQTSRSPPFVDGVWVRIREDRCVQMGSTEKLLDERLSTLKITHPEKVSSLWATSAPLALYLTLMINSRSTELKKVQPTPAQGRLARLRGKAVPGPYTVVTIIPQKAMVQARKEATEHGDRSSPRLHWRRSHIRVIHKGTDKERKIVIPRFIVGRREFDGEHVIKREYRVKLTKPIQETD